MDSGDPSFYLSKREIHAPSGGKGTPPPTSGNIIGVDDVQDAYNASVS